MNQPVIISAVRTPVGRYMGALKDVEAYDLASLVLNEAVKRANLQPDQVDEVIMGQAYQSGEYVNIARMALLKAGWPETIPGMAIGAAARGWMSSGMPPVWSCPVRRRLLWPAVSKA